MNIKMTLKKISLFLCIMVIVLLCPLSVAASPNDDTSQITIKYPLSGVAFYFYKVADVNIMGEYELIGSFKMIAEEVTDLKLLEDAPEQVTAETWRTLSSSLESYINGRALMPDFSMVTDEDGRIVCDVEKGLYLFVAEGKVYGDSLYIPPANFVAVPDKGQGGVWDDQLILDYRNKVGIRAIDDPYTVQKIWVNDEENKKDRPEKIVVDLYMDNQTEPYDTVELSAANNWKYTWKELPAGHKWTASEREVPEHYKVSVVTEGNIISITNEYTPEVPPPPPNIPRTGQLWWPVPFLAIFGIVFFTIGWVRRRGVE